MKKSIAAVLFTLFFIGESALHSQPNQNQQQQMNANMAQMQAIMNNILKTKDPKKRQQLMIDNLNHMTQQMNFMGHMFSGNGGGNMMGNGQGMMGNTNGMNGSNDMMYQFAEMSKLMSQMQKQMGNLNCR